MGPAPIIAAMGERDPNTRRKLVMSPPALSNTREVWSKIDRRRKAIFNPESVAIYIFPQDLLYFFFFLAVSRNDIERRFR
jgi:hypothetical protein